MAMADDSVAERCREHDCCIRVPRVETSPDLSHLAGEWHLRWMPDDRAWFLVPPQGNVFEIRVAEDADPAGELAVDGVGLDDVRLAIARDGLFPPC
jgi:hypothetical protein